MPLFANSYMVIASAEESERNKVIYAKFSNERAPGFNILTKILDDGKRRESVSWPMIRKAYTYIY